MTEVRLRPYQREAIESMRKAFEDDGANSGVLHLFTGAGKTIVTHELVNQLFHPDSSRTIIIGGLNSHLVNQMYNSFRRYSPYLQGRWPHNGTSCPGLGVVMNTQNEASARIVVASIQTLVGGIIDDELSDTFDEEDIYIDCMGGIHLANTSERPYLISPRIDEILVYGPINLWVHDEAHHAPADGSLNILRRFQALHKIIGIDPLKVVGNTATPMRADGRGMSNCFERIFISRSLRWGQANGYLAPFATPIRVVINDTEEDLKDTANWTDMVVKTWKEQCEEPYRPTVIYTGPMAGLTGVKTSIVLTERLNEAGIITVHLDGTKCIDQYGTTHPNSYREKVFEQFMNGEIQVISNCNVIVEGIDLPPISCVMLLKKVNEVSLTQLLGRAVRKFEGNKYLAAKEDTLLIDFTGQQLVTTSVASLMGYTVDPDGQFKEVIDYELLVDEFCMLYDQHEAMFLYWRDNSFTGAMIDLEFAFHQALEGDVELLRPVHARILRRAINAVTEDMVVMDGSDLRDMVREGHVHGVDTIYKLAKIVASSTGDWYADSDTALMSLSVSSSRSLLINPPRWTAASRIERLQNEYVSAGGEIQDNLMKLMDMAIELYSKFTLWEVNTGKLFSTKIVGKDQWLASDSNLDELAGFALVHVYENMDYEPAFLGKGKSWKARTRQGRPVLATIKQLNVLKGLVSKHPGDFSLNYDTITKGDAAKMITHVAASMPIVKLIDKVTGAMNHLGTLIGAKDA